MAAAPEQNITVHTQRKHVAPPREHGRWSVNKIEAMFNLPFPELLHHAQIVHRENFDPTQVEFATLLSVKTGGCAEDCGYCPQAASATHFCMGAAPASTPSARSKPMSLPRLREIRAQGEKITMFTVYDATFAAVADAAGIDCILVGDSLETMRPLSFHFKFQCNTILTS